eukprot:TRINITY_DN10344_c0_g1_i2.p1 TRINITY_DN10344_c0_g1~~TRINITY_DN10344_c0_g1_i2.p1  ORF type:complete len:309 (+),score=53.27 TRINITY_DN10344_c0_g1_i2:200-1126(+)
MLWKARPSPSPPISSPQLLFPTSRCHPTKTLLWKSKPPKSPCADVPSPAFINITSIKTGTNIELLSEPLAIYWSYFCTVAALRDENGTYIVQVFKEADRAPFKSSNAYVKIINLNSEEHKVSLLNGSLLLFNGVEFLESYPYLPVPAGTNIRAFRTVEPPTSDPDPSTLYPVAPHQLKAGFAYTFFFVHSGSGSEGFLAQDRNIAAELASTGMTPPASITTAVSGTLSTTSSVPSESTSGSNVSTSGSVVLTSGSNVSTSGQLPATSNAETESTSATTGIPQAGNNEDHSAAEQLASFAIAIALLIIV